MEEKGSTDRTVRTGVVGKQPSGQMEVTNNKELDVWEKNRQKKKKFPKAVALVQTKIGELQIYKIKKKNRMKINMYRLNEVLHRLIKKAIKATQIYSKVIEHFTFYHFKLKIYFYF